VLEESLEAAAGSEDASSIYKTTRMAEQLDDGDVGPLQEGETGGRC
jgi:hypothetical protein